LEETIEVTFKFKTIQLKTKKNSSTGLIDALASVHPTHGGSSDAPVGLSLWMQAEIKSTISIAPVEPMIPRKSPVHLMYYVPESMFWWTSTHLQHRLNR